MADPPRSKIDTLDSTRVHNHRPTVQTPGAPAMSVTGAARGSPTPIFVDGATSRPLLVCDVPKMRLIPPGGSWARWKTPRRSATSGAAWVGQPGVQVQLGRRGTATELTAAATTTSCSPLVSRRGADIAGIDHPCVVPTPVRPGNGSGAHSRVRPSRLIAPPAPCRAPACRIGPVAPRCPLTLPVAMEPQEPRPHAAGAISTWSTPASRRRWRSIPDHAGRSTSRRSRPCARVPGPTSKGSVSPRSKHSSRPCAPSSRTQPRQPGPPRTPPATPTPGRRRAAEHGRGAAGRAGRLHRRAGLARAQQPLRLPRGAAYIPGLVGQATVRPMLPGEADRHARRGRVGHRPPGTAGRRATRHRSDRARLRGGPGRPAPPRGW